MDFKKKIQVVMGFHGGGFKFGSGYDMIKPEFVMDRELIFVAFNFRQGFLGYLSTEDEVIPGNNALKDQVLAMKWVKDNIATSGGNPDDITITGISSGAVCTHLHYFSPMSKGLFTRGMSQSGTALSSWAIRRNPGAFARKLGELLGCKSGSSVELKRCLKRRSALEIIYEQDNFYGYKLMPYIPFGPVVEKKSKNPFLTEEPYAMLMEKRALDVPWITSAAADEGLFPGMWYYSKMDQVDALWPEMVQYMTEYDYTLPATQYREISTKIKDFYLGKGENFNKENFKKFYQIFTDYLFLNPLDKSAKLQSEANKSPVYAYYFNYKHGETNPTLIYSDVEIDGEYTEYGIGAAHSSDAIYFYGFFMHKNFSKGDIKMKNTCQDILYSFATTGKPSFDGSDNWIPTKGSNLTYLNVTNADDIKLEITEELGAVGFWSSLGLIKYPGFSTKDEL